MTDDASKAEVARLRRENAKLCKKLVSISGLSHTFLTLWHRRF